MTEMRPQARAKNVFTVPFLFCVATLNPLVPCPDADLLLILIFLLAACALFYPKLCFVL